MSAGRYRAADPLGSLTPDGGKFSVGERSYKHQDQNPARVEPSHEIEAHPLPGEKNNGNQRLN